MRTSSELSDRELIVRFLDGHSASFDELVRRYEQAVAGFLYRMVHDDALADDLFQETFLRIMRTLPAYREEGRFKSWMFGIARNIALDALRRKRIEQELFYRPSRNEATGENAPPVGEGADESHAGPDADAERAELRARLEAVLAELPPEQREVVALRFGAGLTFREIAEATGTSINTALGRMRYATAALRKKLLLRGAEEMNDDTP